MHIDNRIFDPLVKIPTQMHVRVYFDTVHLATEASSDSLC